MNEDHPNVVALVAVAKLLEELCDEMVFVGGATIALFQTTPAARQIRATTDVDCLVEVASVSAYHAIDARLRRKGFTNDSESGLICRYRARSYILDVMPTDASILGFGGGWSKEAIATAERREVSGVSIRVVNAVYALATKLSAHLDRGARDPMTSRDLEDVVSLVDGRPELVDEVKTRASASLKSFFRDTFARMLANEQFEDMITGHLPPDRASQMRAPTVMRRLEAIRDG